VTQWLLALAQTLLFIASAPLLAGWIKRCKCRLQNRSAPPIQQPYRDLRRLFAKNVVIADTTSWLFRLAPYVIFGTAVLAASVVPLIATGLPTSRIADVIVLVGFFALARFFQALAALDAGTAFGGMGASREMTIASVAEPAMLLVVFTFAVTANTTNLSTAVDHVLASGLVLRPSFIFIALALLMVAIAETGRVPVDNPATHLELTMVHEAMVLEYSGRHLALIEWASQIKLMLYAVLFVDLFLPWGIATEVSLVSVATGTLAIAVKLAVLGALLAVSETVVAKMRLFRVPAYLGFAFMLGLLGMLSHVILEVG
jgi:formate hydrogenlyase subunit 4